MRFSLQCKWSVGYSRAPGLIERLESRTLLSAAAIDTSFGVGGYVMGYQAAAARPDGFIIASKSASGPAPLALLAPNGNVVSAYSGPVPKPPAQNVQSDGKVLKITGAHSTYTSGDRVTRYNTNGTVDTSFGNGGTVILTSTISNFLFYPSQVLVHGSQIYVSGYGNPESPEGDINGSAGYVIVEAFNLNGTINRAFGFAGAMEIRAGDEYYGNPFDLIGPDGEIYVADDFDCSPMVWRFTTAGKPDGDFNGPEENVDAAPVLGLAFARDHKILILAQNDDLDLKLYRVGRNFAYDTTFGSGGMMSIRPPVDPSLGYTSNSGNLVLRDDGEIIIGANFDPLLFTTAISPGAAAGTGSISGRIFNDINNNHKQDIGEPGLAWWQAYADLNNNGIFDAGEPTAYADATGAYIIGDLAPGKYLVREVRQNNWTRTTPAGNWPTGGLYHVTVIANKTVAAINFGNSIANHAKGSLSGTIFNDLNRDRILDNQEPGLAGWQVYADVNDNGIYDVGEPIATANSKGQYALSNLQVGGYRLREVRQNGWVRTSPAGNWPLGYYDISLAAGQSIGGLNFGNSAVAGAAMGTAKVSFQPMSAINGLAFNDLDGNGIFNSDENITTTAWIELPPWRWGE